MYLSGCYANLDAMNIRIGGSAISFIVNMFSSTIAGQLKRLVVANLCRAATGVVMQQANAFLAQARAAK